MSLTDILADLKEWLMTLPPEFVFLLALPLVVAAAGLLREWLARPRTESSREPARGHERRSHPRSSLSR